MKHRHVWIHSGIKNRVFVYRCKICNLKKYESWIKHLKRKYSNDNNRKTNN